MVWKITFTTLDDLLECFFISHVRNCVMAATQMQTLIRLSAPEQTSMYLDSSLFGHMICTILMNV